MGTGRHGGRLSPHAPHVTPNKPGRHGGRGTVSKPTYDVDGLRANDFVVTKAEDGYSRMADGLVDFFRNSKSKQKKDRAQ
jgi:hypothetical protein